MTESLSVRIYNASPAGFQNLLLSRVGARLRQRRFGEDYRRWMDLCSRAETWSRDEQRAYADEQVRLVVQRARSHVPYYRRVMQERGLTGADIRGVSDLVKLPVLTKDGIRAHRDEMIADDVDRRSLILGHTSGSTGAALEFWWDLGVEVATNAMIWRHRRFASFEFGRPYATLLGRVVVPRRRQRPPFWRLNKPWNQLFLSTFHMQQDNLGLFVDAIQRHGAEALEAYPSTAYILARWLEAEGRKLPLKAVFTSTETLLEIQREVIEERFACGVFDYYGQAERVMYSGECASHSGHHQFIEYGAMEVLDDDGEPQGPGQTGRLVLTGFANASMPLIRYEIGDVGGWSEQSCPCGRTLPLLSGIATKAEDIVVTPDGRYLSPSALTHPFKPLNSIEASQIIQERVDLMRILVVRRPGYVDADTRALTRSIRERVGPDMEIRVEFVDSIPRGPRGKLRWVISKVPLTFGGRNVGNLHGG